MTILTAAQNPVELSDGRIMLDVQFDDEVVWSKYVADANDIEALGSVIHSEALAGLYGAVAAYVAPPFDATAVAALRLQALAARRYQAEASGVIIAGMLHPTDRQSQAMLSAAFSSLSVGFVTETQWKGADGWATVTLTEVAVLAALVAQHIAACFANERAHADAIVALGASLAAEFAAETKTAEQITAEIAAYNIETGWPVTIA